MTATAVHIHRAHLQSQEQTVYLALHLGDVEAGVAGSFHPLICQLFGHLRGLLADVCHQAVVGLQHMPLELLLAGRVPKVDIVRRVPLGCLLLLHGRRSEHRLGLERQAELLEICLCLK